MSHNKPPLLWSLISDQHRRYLLASFAVQGLLAAALYAICGLLFLRPHITPGLIVFIAGYVLLIYLHVFGQTVAVVAIQDAILARPLSPSEPPGGSGKE